MKKRYFKFQLSFILICCLFLTTVGFAADKLGSYGIDKNSISVSGISSGGFMAQQFHVAHSKSIIGAGVIAGGPYFCARGTIYNLCSCVNIKDCFNGPADISESIDKTKEEAGLHRIDSPENMKTSRVWLFSGGKDTIVPTAVMNKVREYYKVFLNGENIRYVKYEDAAHAMISPNAKNACAYTGTPYLNNCDNYDAAGELLTWIYNGRLGERGVADSTHLLEFDQTEFFDTNDESISMDETGFIYVPADCTISNSQGGCRLHVVFHGCDQYQGIVGNKFYTNAGYNEWAETNRIIILYPQIKKWEIPWYFKWAWWTTQNPEGCWDWWGYSDNNYYVKDGKQIKAVKMMIDRLAK